MAKRYIFVRMPEDVFNLYRNVKIKMETDISRLTGKPTSLTMPKVFRAVVSPEINENYIQIDFKKLIELGNGRYKKQR